MIRINLLRDPHSQPAAAKVSAIKDKPAKAIKNEVKPMSESTRKPTPIVGIFMCLVIASIGGAYYWWLNNNFQVEEGRNGILNAEKRELEPYFKLEEQFRAQKESLQKKETALTKLKKQQQMPVYFLQELINSLPDNVGFVKLTSKGQKIEIRGESPTEDAIYQFEQNLRAKSQWFSNVVYGGAQRKTGTVAGYDFGITFDLMNP